MNQQRKYVLVTPTKDEERTIGTTIASVVSQTVPPAEWIIVSDGSSDNTDSIIQKAQLEHGWIQLIQLPQRKERCFGAVTRATKVALAALTVNDYGYIGLLDSDLSFEKDYFEKVLEAFESEPGLGVAGGVVIDPGVDPSLIPDNTAEVPGAVQFYRRACFEDLRDIYVIPEGGWDTLTCAEARLNGYTTRLLWDLKVDHLKPRNSGVGGRIMGKWQLGAREFAIGYHPVFQAIKCVRRFREPPILLAGLARFLGYLCAFGIGKKHAAPEDLVRLIRKEQMARVKELVSWRKNKVKI